MAKTVRLIGATQKAYAHRLIEDAPADFIMKLAKATRSDAQNRRLWPMIDDIRRQVPEMAPYSAEDVKMRFMHALGSELRFLPDLEGQGMFPVGMRSSVLTIEQFGGLLELLFSYCAKHVVAWSDPQEMAA